MGAKLGATKGGFSEINMTPLIDIVLVVLIIMMVNIPIQIETMGLKLPAKLETPPPPQPPSDQLMIMMYEDGKLALNRRVMTEEQMFEQVTRRLRPMDPKNVFIDAAATVPFGRVVDMMDLAREAGAMKVGVTKMKPSGPPQWTEVETGSIPRGMTVGNPAVIGPMSQTDADDALKPHTAQLEKCYLTGLATTPTMNGRVLAKIGVGPQGEVLEHSIGSSALNDATVEACIDQVLGTFKFKSLGGNKTALVQYPLLFSPG